MEAMRLRRAVREYLPEAIEEATIRVLIDAAIQAPSAMNRQDWLFVIVSDRERLASIAARAKAFMLARLEADDGPEEARSMLAAPDFDIFYGAPVLAAIYADNPDPMAEQDVCLAAQNLMLAARALGIGTCWIGFATAWLNQPQAKRELGAPRRAKAVAPIILGRPTVWPPARGRRDPDIRWLRG
nr:nitroreductase family protein [Caulobacter sp. CCUG 60055]